MPAGLEVYRPDGSLRFSLAARPVNILGLVLDTGIYNGSRAISGVVAGVTPSFFMMPLGDFARDVEIPNVYVSGNVLYWTFAQSGNVNNLPHRILYGVW